MCVYIPIISEYPYLTKGLKILLQLGLFTSAFLTGFGLTYVLFAYPREYMYLFLYFYSTISFCLQYSFFPLFLWETANRDTQIVIKIVFIIFLKELAQNPPLLASLPWHSKLVI